MGMPMSIAAMRSGAHIKRSALPSRMEKGLKGSGLSCALSLSRGSALQHGIEGKLTRLFRKTSSPANRMLFLEYFGIRIATRKRNNLGPTLARRYTKAWYNLTTSSDTLRHVVIGRSVYSPQGSQGNNGSTGTTTTTEADTTSGAHAAAGTGTDDEKITEALLRDQLSRRATYFATTIPLAASEHVTIYDSLLAEMDLEKKIKDADDKHARRELTDDEHTKLLDDMKASLLSTMKATTDGLLAKRNQTRAEWRVGGERWKVAARKRHPEANIYDRLVNENKAKEELASKEASGTAAQITAARDKLKRQQEATDKVLADRGSTRDLWAEDNHLFRKYQVSEATSKLERIYRRILRQAASRSLEMRELKARTSGHKKAAEIVKAIQKKYPQIDADIKEFNQVSATITDDTLRPPELTMAAFIASDDDSDIGDKARDALFSLHLLRTTILLGMEDEAFRTSSELWARSALVRTGIRELSRQDRAKEEIDEVKKEWHRILTYAQEFLRTLLDHLLDPLATCKKAVAWMLWDEIQTAELLIKAEESVKKKVPHIASHLSCPVSLHELIQRCTIRVFEILHRPDGARQRGATAGVDPTGTGKHIQQTPSALVLAN